MKGKAHVICGLACGIGTALLGKFNIPECMTVVAASTLFSVVPDVDLPDSKLGHIIKPVSKFINKVFGHRTFTHSGLWLIPFVGLAWYFYNTEYFAVFAGMFIGLLSHLISDTLTKGGVPWLWPFKKKRYTFSVIKSGKFDYFPCIFTVAITLFLCILVFKYTQFLRFNII